MVFEKIMKIKIISEDSELEDDESVEEFLVNFLNDEFYKDALTFERVLEWLKYNLDKNTVATANTINQNTEAGIL